MDYTSIENKAEDVMKGLKNFQRSTVKYIDELFRQNRNRVLVADEVGLGKTLIARGCISQTALLLKKNNAASFRVAYVCSNQLLAKKNIETLDVFDTLKDLDDKDKEAVNGRLPMQHLYIAKQNYDISSEKRFIQFNAITPKTSFDLKRGQGNCAERALMFAILKRTNDLKHYTKKLEESLIRNASSSWDYECKKYEDIVSRLENQTRQEEIPYPESIISQIKESHEYSATMSDVADTLKSGNPLSASQISDLRMMFAKISVQNLNPDLVIMDEFQRFDFLIKKAGDNPTEMEILADKFLKSMNTKVLLLSATPYKLYSTPEEIEESPENEHYKEFMNVMDFLFEDDKVRNEFHKVWKEYSNALNLLKNNGFEVLQLKKEAAESFLRKGICRTERLSVMDGNDFIDDESTKTPMPVLPEDIKSFIQGSEFVEEVLGSKIPVDYVKSCPFLLSYMSNYTLMDSLKKYFKKYPDKLRLINRDLLWLDTKKIDKYEPLPESNARLQLLKDHVFRDKSELYLWIPPCKPYYPFEGVYQNSEGYSKLLLFSAWEMVPRMVGTLMSYEAERLTYGKLGECNERYSREKYYSEDASYRYPVARLKGGNEWYLLYPSQFLSKLYNPIECLNAKMTLKDIKNNIKSSIQEKLKVIKEKCQCKTGKIDKSWYLIAPMMMDDIDYVNDWCKGIEDDGEEQYAIGKIIHRFLDEGQVDFDSLEMGSMPDDLVEILTSMSIASPANCIYRTNGDNSVLATELADYFIRLFNSPEHIAVVDLAVGIKSDDAHWQNVLKYCIDGNFQSMFDEYWHIIKERERLKHHEEDLNLAIHNKICDSMQINTANYVVETKSSFESKIRGNKEDLKKTRMRTHFAVAFINTKGDNEKDSNRKESIQDAFNSPFRPFVLASTSIGQEGLDFHNYCRKIMHWNLPGNPIDFEQREGRVNRYKCLAIRQNLALKYDSMNFNGNVWDEIFAKAEKDLCPEGKSELIPFWCLGEDQKIKIERIVPMYPLSKDQQKYERLIKILSLYRTTLGQSRQEELLHYLFTTIKDVDKLKDLFFDLSPFSYGK